MNLLRTARTILIALTLTAGAWAGSAHAAAPDAAAPKADCCSPDKPRKDIDAWADTFGIGQEKITYLALDGNAITKEVFYQTLSKNPKLKWELNGTATYRSDKKDEKKGMVVKLVPPEA